MLYLLMSVFLLIWTVWINVGFQKLKGKPRLLEVLGMVSYNAPWRFYLYLLALSTFWPGHEKTLELIAKLDDSYINPFVIKLSYKWYSFKQRVRKLLRFGKPEPTFIGNLDVASMYPTTQIVPKEVADQLKVQDDAAGR